MIYLLKEFPGYAYNSDIDKVFSRARGTYINSRHLHGKRLAPHVYKAIYGEIPLGFAVHVTGEGYNKMFLKPERRGNPNISKANKTHVRLTDANENAIFASSLYSAARFLNTSHVTVRRKMDKERINKIRVEKINHLPTNCRLVKDFVLENGIFVRIENEFELFLRSIADDVASSD